MRRQKDRTEKAVERGRILFLDRDGTLNRSYRRRPPNSLDEVELLPGVVRVLLRYQSLGWTFVIVSNQGGVSSGYFSEAEARAIQQRVVDLLPVPVAASYLCPHMPGGTVAEYAVECPNRKPNPGFILTALEQLGGRAEDALFVGDASTDREAAQAAGVAFRWADLFFGRAIDRGVRAANGRWVQLREAAPAEWAALGTLTASWSELAPSTRAADGAGSLTLVALRRGIPVGWLSLIRGESATEADLAFAVDPDCQLQVSESEGSTTAWIGSLLLESALDWARAQPDLNRLCVEVLADNLPISRLCCRHGFEERSGANRLAGEGLVSLDCSV